MELIQTVHSNLIIICYRVTYIKSRLYKVLLTFLNSSPLLIIFTIWHLINPLDRLINLGGLGLDIRDGVTERVGEGFEAILGLDVRRFGFILSYK